jgi:PAS domain S-box-containing protein
MKTILIIQEDKILRENICDFLKEEGYDVIYAEDGLTGLQLAVENLPDLILCDIIMPKMNGYDFYKTIKKINNTSIIPLIFLTAKAEKEDVRAGMHLGADDYITSPFDFNELLFSVKTRLDKFEKIQQKSDEKFYALIDNPSIGVFIYSKSKFDFMNEKCAKIFGLSPDEISDITFNDLVIGNEIDYVMEKIDGCFNKIQNTVHIRFHVLHLKGKHNVTVEMYAGMVYYKGSDSLIGNITECIGVNNSLFFSDVKDKSAEALSKKELKILIMICQGLFNSEIAQILELSKRTIESHRASIMNKTDVKNTADLVIYAIRNNII